ncbi:uncharacterized protein TNCV_3719201 [Trichonephila clavipes]|nr:uncharacterized protein TNCV_3719201 [Trichonephila clavipes]
MMEFLLKQTKEVLLEVAIDLGVEVHSTLTKLEIKNRICQSKYYDEESVKCLLEGILEEEREKQEIKEYEERRLARERELERLRIQLRNKLNENKLKAGNRINDLANVCILSEKRTAEVSEPVNKCRLLNNPVVNKNVENATSCDFEKKNCDPPVICTNVSHPSEVGRKEFNVNRSSDCDVEMKVGVCEGRVKTVAMGAQRVIIPDNIVDGSFELKRDKVVANPEGLISDVRKCWEDGLALRLPLSEPREIYKDELATDNRSNIGSEITFEIDLPGKRYRSTIYRLNLIKLYRRKPELANLVMENSSEGIDSETLYSVKLFMDFGFQGSGDSRRVAIMDFGAPLTIGEAYLKIIMSSFLGFCEWNTRNRWHDGQMCPDVDKELWRLGADSSGGFGVLCANRKKEEVKRDFDDLRIRRSEGRVVNTPLVFKRVLFQETRGDPEKEKERGGDPKGEDEQKRRKELGKEKG